jgi:hypothetical protein
MAEGSVRPCNHVWVANSGKGGKPDFRPNRQMSYEPLMHVACRTCWTRTWLTKAQWDAQPHGPLDHLDRAGGHK